MHQKYRLFTKLGLQGAFLAGLLKIFVVIFIFIIQAGYLKAFEGRVGTNYSIFIDSAVSGGGNLASTTYDMDASFGEAIASSRTSSNSYNEASGVTALTDEPHISFTVDGGLASLGVLTNQTTSYNTSTFNVSYNGLSGYDVVLFGTPPTNQAGDVIDPIGGTSDFPTTDTEQFGINLRGNTNPAVVGSDPTGGLGAVVGQYGIVNKYAFNIGDIVATSTVASSRTDYTATIITNISNVTPAGSYIGTLEFSLVPKF